MAEQIEPPAPVALPVARPSGYPGGRGGILMAVAILAAASVLPVFLTNFVIFQFTLVMVYGISVMGLTLLIGISGQFSLGNGAFYAFGAYACVLLMQSAGLSYVFAIPLAGISCFAVGILFGMPARRLDGLYLALATFALAIATPQILKSTLLEHWTGGIQGLFVIRPAVPSGLPISEDTWLYYVTLFITALLYWMAANLIQSRTGRALRALQDNDIAARSMGVDVALYKTLVFGISAFFTGISGALGALAVQFIAPDSFTLTLSILLFVAAVIGGVNWLPGALIGGAFILFVPSVVDRIDKGLTGAIYGILLIAIILVAPSGAGGLFRKLKSLVNR